MGELVNRRADIAVGAIRWVEYYLVRDTVSTAQCDGREGGCHRLHRPLLRPGGYLHHYLQWCQVIFAFFAILEKGTIHYFKAPFFNTEESIIDYFKQVLVSFSAKFEAIHPLGIFKLSF